MPRSEQINELATALCEAQGSFPILQKRTKAYNYMYADYAEIKECVQPVLQAHGLCITSDVDWEKGVLTMALVHTSGQSLTCPIKLHYKADGKVNEMQAMGSALTYARRYAICCLLDLAADKESDDDGERSSPKGYSQHTGEVHKPEEKEPGKPLTEAQCAELDALLNDDLKKDWITQQICQKHSIPSVYDMDSNMFAEAKKWLLNRKKMALEKK